MSSVTTDDEAAARARLAELIHQRRIQCALSVRQAADQAGLARNTWAAIEDGSRRTSQHKYTHIERVLRWQEGSITKILNGGQPAPLDAPAPAPADNPNLSAADRALIRIMQSDLGEAEKARIMQQIIREQEKANQHIAALAEQYANRLIPPPA